MSKNRTFVQKLKFLSKIELLFKNRNFGQNFFNTNKGGYLLDYNVFYTTMPSVGFRHHDRSRILDYKTRIHQIYEAESEFYLKNPELKKFQDVKYYPLPPDPNKHFSIDYVKIPLMGESGENAEYDALSDILKLSPRR